MDTLEGGFLAFIKPVENWKGDQYIKVRIQDNSMEDNSIYEDSIKIHVGNMFKGLIDTTEIFQDTVKIIGDVIVDSIGDLLIKMVLI